MAASKCRSGPETGREARRVTADLAEYLSSDRYPLHSRLPPERQLCELLEVSRTALRNGLEEPEREGRIWRHVGKGTFVGGRPQSVQSCAEALGADTTLSDSAVDSRPWWNVVHGRCDPRGQEIERPSTELGAVRRNVDRIEGRRSANEQAVELGAAESHV